MVNIGLNWSSIIGIALVASGLLLFGLRSFRPNLARDHDIFFAAIALVSGLILFFNGWRQDPILQFGQSMVAGSAIFFAVESIRLRGITTTQAKRAASSAPVVDDERPVSRVYRAELDELEPYDERPATRRIRGSRDPRPNRVNAYMDDYYGDAPRRPSSRSGPAGRIGPSDRDRPPRRPPRPTERPSQPNSGWGEAWGDEPPARRRPDSDLPGPPPSRGSASVPPSRPPARRPRPPRDDNDRGSARGPGLNNRAGGSNYVDYQPLEPPEGRPDRPNDFE